MQWSYDLLTLDERMVFNHLSVFAGAFDVVAVEEVCTGTSVDHTDVADVIASLVDKSMVVVDRTGAHARFSLLETLRHFAFTRLRDHGDLDGARTRHLSHFVNRAEHCQRLYEGNSHVAGAAAFKHEWDNFRAAMTFAGERQEATAARRLLRALFFFSWFDIRHELGQWAEHVTTRGIEDPVNDGVGAFFAVQRGDREAGLRLAEKGATRAGRSATPAVWICSFAAAFAHWYAGRVEEGWLSDKRTNESIDPDADPFASVITTCITTSHACYVEADAARGYLEHARPLPGPSRTRPSTPWSNGYPEWWLAPKAASRRHSITSITASSWRNASIIGFSPAWPDCPSPSPRLSRTLHTRRMR